MSLSGHHAYVAYGSPSKLKEFAAYMAHELGLAIAGNPDFHMRDYSNEGDGASFDVEEARSLSAFSEMHSTNGTKVFVIGANTVTREAQNALLKTLEEPTRDTVFAFLVPRGALIGTVRSRVIELPWQPKVKDDARAKEFLSATTEKRSALVASILKEKDKESARELLDAVERCLHANIARPDVQKGLSELAVMRSYLMDRSPSLKMILEHMALVLPQVAQGK